MFVFFWFFVLTVVIYSCCLGGLSWLPFMVVAFKSVMRVGEHHCRPFVVMQPKLWWVSICFSHI